MTGTLRRLGRPLAAYRELFAVPGPARFVSAGFVSRLTTSMINVALVLAITAHGGRYATAGAVVAVLIGFNAAALPVMGRWFDRHGQDRVLVPMVLVFGTLVGGMTAVVATGASDLLLFPLAAAAGLVMPVVGPLVRARWTKIYQGTPKLRVAYGFEGATIEIVYIVGPVIVTFLSTKIGPTVGIVAVAVAALAGTLALAVQRSTQPVPTGTMKKRGAGPLRFPALRALYVTRFGMGGVLGSMPILTVAYASAHHARALSGLMLAAWGFASMIAGLVYGALETRAPLQRRLLVSVVLLSVGLLPLLAVHGMVSLALLLALAGFAIAPVAVSAMEMMQRLAPAALFTETMSWDGTALASGVTAGSLVGGAVVAHLPIGLVFVVPIGFGCLALIVVLGCRQVISRGLTANPPAEPVVVPAPDAGVEPVQA
jgi:MFS family permease